MNPPHEFKVLRVRECQPEPAMIDTPERAVEYWRANIPFADWFYPAKEGVCRPGLQHPHVGPMVPFVRSVVGCIVATRSRTGCRNTFHARGFHSPHQIDHCTKTASNRCFPPKIQSAVASAM